VRAVDLARYVRASRHEVRALPHRFEDAHGLSCADVTAALRAPADGRIAW
jgi:hypothetical protein